MGKQKLFDLAGKVALVTGASRGIGRAVALGLAGAGADVAVVSRGEPVLETAAQVEKLGRRSLALREDISRPETASIVVQEVVKHFGRLDTWSTTRAPPGALRASSFPMRTGAL